LTALLGHTKQTCTLWTNDRSVAGAGWYTPVSGKGLNLPADPIGGLLDGEKGAQMMWDDTSKRY
jgi:hypothetical protein